MRTYISDISIFWKPRLLLSDFTLPICFNWILITPLHSVVMIPQLTPLRAISPISEGLEPPHGNLLISMCPTLWRIELHHYNCLTLGIRIGALIMVFKAYRPKPLTCLLWWANASSLLDSYSVKERVTIPIKNEPLCQDLQGNVYWPLILSTSGNQLVKLFTTLGLSYDCVHSLHLNLWEYYSCTNSGANRPVLKLPPSATAIASNSTLARHNEFYPIVLVPSSL